MGVVSVVILTGGCFSKSGNRSGLLLNDLLIGTLSCGTLAEQ